MSDLDYEVINIDSISTLLTALQNQIPEVDENSERFYRGLSSEEYVKVDYPSIYRSKKETIKVESKDVTIEYDPYIKYEDKIYHDIIAKAPNEFKECENTFERLVKMQHYGTPTRLLDVTTNPLIALYFACVNGDGTTSFDKDGAIVIYDIPQSNIKNFSNDAVIILANFAKLNTEYTPLFAMLNDIKKESKKIKNIVDDGLAHGPVIKQFITMIEDYTELLNGSYLRIEFLLNLSADFIYSIKILISKYNDSLNSFLNMNYIPVSHESRQKFKEECKHYLTFIIERINNYPLSKIELNIENSIRSDRPYFKIESIKTDDLINIFCVKPKLTNQRIINQNGAFLLFGFENYVDNKLIIPMQHFKYKPLNSNSSKLLHIKIPKNQKKKLVDALKLLGIDRSFIYPEIENISKVITDKYTKNPH